MTPRGFRNNNPGNLRKTHTEWVGELLGEDKEFETFDTMEHGIRALARVLMTYQRDRHCKTVGQIISRYAPFNENDTPSYVRAVAKHLKVTVDEPINLSSNDLILCALIQAICRHENGRKEDGEDWVDAETIIRGVDMAREG